MVERLRAPHPTQPLEVDAGIVTLYHGFTSGSLNCIFSTKVRLLCEVCGLRYRIVDIDLLDKPAWFSEISPKLEVPVAYVEGKLIVDSAETIAVLKSLVLYKGQGNP